MAIIGVEEHFVIEPIADAWRALDPQWQDVSLAHSSTGERGRRLVEAGPERIAAMDEVGLDVVVVSPRSPGVQNLGAADAVALQTEFNDRLADAVKGSGGRFHGLATLATPSPDKAAAELQRAVGALGLDGAMLFGRTRERNLDDPVFEPILEAAAALRAPLYIHPQTPRAGVREAYYDGLGDDVDAALATHGIGWHYESGMQLLRLILSGAFDRHPELQVIVGHWGEVVLFYLDRVRQLEGSLTLQRRIQEYVRDHVHVSAGGFLDRRYMGWREVSYGTPG